MASVQVKAQLTYDELLRAVEQLNPPDLEKFVSQVISLRARKKAKGFSKSETELFLKINQKIDPKLQKRFDELTSKRRAETLTSGEYKELLKLTDEIEKFDVKRVEYLAELAQLRNTTLSELMKELGIQTPEYVL